VIPLLSTVEWRGFLARRRLPSPSLDALDALHHQSMLVTGAGGSIGSALAQRLAALGPPGLVLLDSSESRLYKLQQEWVRQGLPGPMTPVLGSVVDRALLDEVFMRHKPRIVFHAAAFKHVPLLEGQPLAAIANNIFGTLTLMRIAVAHKARVVLLSTDKAAEPSSVMGATKRISELIVMASGGVVLRLGNVLATRDSVTEGFARQIAAGRPLTITDPAARRYFLTVDEAVNMLLIAAAELEAPLLLAPELSAPHFITDLAHFMAKALAPERAVEIDFTHPRPGDKEVERLWSAAETPRPAQTAGLLSIQSPLPPIEQLEDGLTGLRIAVDDRDLPAALTHLKALVPDYVASSAVLALANHRAAS
jgi:FlaA1/EpsC-like NDP-sugar epimerase